MKKNEYIDMLIADNQTEDNEGQKKLNEDIIDCVYISFAEENNDFEVDSKISLDDLYKIIENRARKLRLKCVGLFEAAELFAKKFGSSFNRPSKRPAEAKSKRVNLEDFL